MDNIYNDINFLNKIYNQNINFKNQVLIIKGKKIPNFYLNQCNQILNHQMMIFELNHLIDKLLFTHEEDLTFYETSNFKIESNDIVFDCGGNMGLFAASIANRSKNIYSFEPMSLIRKNLEKVSQLYSNINIVPMGLWNQNTNLFLLQKDNPGASHVEYLNQNNENKTLYREKCNMTTIDFFIKNTGIIPTFIKMDIEGSEVQLLEGAKNCLKNYKPKLSIALHYDDTETIEYIIKMLLEHNYIYQILATKHGILLLGENYDNIK